MIIVLELEYKPKGLYQFTFVKAKALHSNTKDLSRYRKLFMSIP